MGNTLLVATNSQLIGLRMFILVSMYPQLFPQTEFLDLSIEVINIEMNIEIDNRRVKIPKRILKGLPIACSFPSHFCVLWAPSSATLCLRTRLLSSRCRPSNSRLSLAVNLELGPPAYLTSIILCLSRFKSRSWRAEAETNGRDVPLTDLMRSWGARASPGAV